AMRRFKACLSGAAAVLLASTSASADFVNLTTPGSSGTINSAVFLEDATQPAGVGVFQPFLRLQASPTEQGLNTDATPVPYDDKSAANWTHSVRLSDVGVVSYQGAAYRAFGLDINQSDSGGNPLLNLTQLQLFTASQPNLTSVGQLGTPLYDLNAGGGNNAVILNSGINPGLG